MTDKRLCKLCENLIVHRPPQARYCEDCGSNVRRKVHRKIRQLEVNLSAKVTPCEICDNPIEGRRNGAIYCHNCATDDTILNKHRYQKTGKRIRPKKVQDPNEFPVEHTQGISMVQALRMIAGFE